MAVENVPGFGSINLLPVLFQLAWTLSQTMMKNLKYAVQTDLFKIG